MHKVDSRADGLNGKNCSNRSCLLPPLPLRTPLFLALELMQFAIGLCMRPPNEQTSPGAASECLHVRKFTRTELLHDERLWMLPLRRPRRLTGQQPSASGLSKLLA